VSEERTHTYIYIYIHTHHCPTQGCIYLTKGNNHPTIELDWIEMNLEKTMLMDSSKFVFKCILTNGWFRRIGKTKSYQQ